MNEIDHKRPGILAANLGDPIKLAQVNIHGVLAEAARPGEQASVWTRLFLTSDERFFHTIVENLNEVISAALPAKNHNLARKNSVLLVMHADNTGDIWIDAAAVTVRVRMKKPAKAGSLIFQQDIADITGMDFPLVQISKEDRVMYLFREGWRFGLFFDFNPDMNFSREDMIRDLGTLHRELKYRHLYDVVADGATFERLTNSGWFPFVEIIGPEFKELANACAANFELDEEEKNILARFDEKRLENMFSRWMEKSHFIGKEKILRSALNAFKAGDSVAVLKIILTEIEGILSEAYIKTHGKGAPIKNLLQFAIEMAEKKAGGRDTLFLTTAFAHYLENCTFANYDPIKKTGNANSRHAVGHGAADAGSYTQARALQALLTLDQIAFYT